MVSPLVSVAIVTKPALQDLSGFVCTDRYVLDNGVFQPSDEIDTFLRASHERFVDSQISQDSVYPCSLRIGFSLAASNVLFQLQVADCGTFQHVCIVIDQIL